jgi:hypothetical protein
MEAPEMWSAIRKQAMAWRETPTLIRFKAELPRNASQRSSGIPGLLQSAHAGAGALFANPMRLATALGAVVGQMPGLEERDRQENAAWLDSASRVEQAHRLTIAWIRSRLPGYPSLVAPQLAPNTPLTTTELTPCLVWEPQERKLGLHLQNPPRQIADALNATEDQRRNVDAAARALGVLVSQTQQFRRLGAANARLEAESRRSLRGCYEQVRDRLASDQMNAFEPHNALRRASFRSAVVSEEIQALTGLAAEYSEAFTSANSLIDFMMSDVFGQLVCYPVGTITCADLEILPAQVTHIEFTSTDSGEYPDPGMVVWLDDALVEDAVRIEDVTLSWASTGQSTLRLTASVLAGTALAWPRAAGPTRTGMP